ncbi:MAG: ketosteroid isomerase-related protein [Gammaproteobacteria bacterium]
MSNPTETLINRYYQAFNDGDMATFFSLLSDDVVHDINQGRRETGKDAFKQFMAHMNHCYREHIRDLVVLSNSDGQRAAAEFIVDGEYLNTDSGLPEAHGQTYSLPAGAFFDIRGGQISRISNFYNLQDWLQQVGA